MTSHGAPVPHVPRVSLWLCSGKPTGTFRGCSAPSLAGPLVPLITAISSNPPDIPSALWVLIGVPKTLAALTFSVEPSWQGPQEQPWPFASSRIALCFLPSPHPLPMHWVSPSPFLEEVQETQVALPGLAAWLAWQVWE